MGKHLIMVNSITYAIKGRDLLRSNGHKAYIEKTPVNLDSHGCGYRIIVYDKLDKAVSLLKGGGIKILGTTERE